MALFKIFKGNATGKITDPNNPEYIQPTAATDGYAYYDTSTRKFYINADYNNDGTITRQPINAYHADGADAATLAQAAIYETTGEEGASVNSIRSYYAHNLFRSGDSIQLRNGLGIDIGDNIDISDKQNSDFILKYQDSGNTANMLIVQLLFAEDSLGTNIDLDDNKFINKEDFYTFLENAIINMGLDRNVKVILQLGTVSSGAFELDFNLKIFHYNSNGSSVNLIGSLSYGNINFMLILNPNEESLNAQIQIPGSTSQVYQANLNNNNELIFSNTSSSNIWNDISDTMDGMVILNSSYGKYFIKISNYPESLVLALIGKNEVSEDDFHSYQAIFSTSKDDIIYTAYIYQNEDNNHKSYLEISSINDKLNLALNNYLPLSGGTMTGNLILNTNPSSNMQAANKQYVDNSINSLDVSNISGFGTGKTLKTLTETDGKIAATFQDIAITKSQITDFPGYWANIVTTTTATYNKEPEFKTMKLGNGTSATGTKSVQLVYDATLEALNFVFA